MSAPRSQQPLRVLCLARLALSGFYPPVVAASLPEAVLEASRACERLGGA